MKKLCVLFCLLAGIAFAQVQTNACKNCSNGQMISMNGDVQVFGSISFLAPLTADVVVTPGSGTGITPIYSGAIRRVVFKETVSYTNFVANGQTADVVLATLPAKSVVYRLVAALTTPFVCAATCTTATLSMTCGKSAGGNEYLLSFDADAAAATFGDAIGEVGAAVNATNLLDIPSMSATTSLQCRMTSGTGNIGDGTTTNFNAGSITFYLIYEVLP